MGHVFFSVSNRHLRFNAFLQLIAVAVLLKYYFIPKDNSTGSLLGKFNKWLKKFSPWKVMLATASLQHLGSKFSLLLGMNAPHTSLYHAPDVNYSPTFSRARWLLTALDAGVLSCHKISHPWLRYPMSLLCGIFYLFNIKKAEIKVAQFRKSLKIEHVRAMWEKGGSPVLHGLTSVVRRLKGEVVRVNQIVHIPRPNNKGVIECSLFYDKPLSALAQETQIILDFPGGGFVSMSPKHHADYLSKWTRTLKVPVLSVNYRKAPECPYPSGFNDCFDVYQLLQSTQGGIIGMNTATAAAPLTVLLAGDSAGGNLVAAVTCRALAEGVATPAGVHMIYPALDMAGDVWCDADGKDGTTNKTVMTSRALYAYDGVLPFKYQLMLGQAYFRNGGNPKTDIYISPLRAPAELLAQFPPTYIHCGGVDPLLDDSVDFIQALKKANPDLEASLHTFPGVSHAYMQITEFLPEGREANKLSMQWLGRMLQQTRTKSLTASVVVREAVPEATPASTVERSPLDVQTLSSTAPLSAKL
jgi:acetyl esterase/lipase